MPNSAPQKSTTIYVFFGMIATGKSSIAGAWSWEKKVRCYNSDWIRKELAGVDPTKSSLDTVDTGIYTKEFSHKTYDSLLERAEVRLKQGDSVILDASYQYAKDRQDVRELAKNCKARLYFIYCQCPEEEMKRRMDEREKDPAAVSDGRWEVYLKQRDRFEPPDEIPAAELILLNTGDSLEEILEYLIKMLP